MGELESGEGDITLGGTSALDWSEASWACKSSRSASGAAPASTKARMRVTCVSVVRTLRLAMSRASSANIRLEEGAGHLQGDVVLRALEVELCRHAPLLGLVEAKVIGHAAEQGDARSDAEELERMREVANWLVNGSMV